MQIMVCNIGSTSLKFQLIEMDSQKVLAKGHTDRVGSENAAVTYWKEGEELLQEHTRIPSHREAVEHALDFLVDAEFSILPDLKAIDAVGFKTIQAGDKNGSVLLTQDVLNAMEDYKALAPAHNPPYLTAIYMFRELLPNTPLVGVFEPGFHVDAPEYAKVYGTPYEWYETYGVKKYGYHGASHRFVTWETVRILGLNEDDHKIITCHLGGSSSLCAFKNGRSIDTSMGFTPQSGLLQSTRIGDMDPYVLPYIMERKGIDLDTALKECSQNAGLAGLSGTSGDMRDIRKAEKAGDKRAKLARDKFIYDIKRYIGEYIVLMEGVDAITFTGGIGQQDADLRQRVLSSLHFLGLEINQQKNKEHAQIISSNTSNVRALILDTNEEWVVAQETFKVINN
ncbi:acetate/propionate family kinase [candidate division KSB1 bacterium]|nr:acetate/propionate family kinase [candidate division KSB1 bacterium]